MVCDLFSWTLSLEQKKKRTWMKWIKCTNCIGIEWIRKSNWHFFLFYYVLYHWVMWIAKVTIRIQFNHYPKWMPTTITHLSLNISLHHLFQMRYFWAIIFSNVQPFISQLIANKKLRCIPISMKTVVLIHAVILRRIFTVCCLDQMVDFHAIIAMTLEVQCQWTNYCASNG